MNTTNDIQKRILELKKEQNAVILAHCYQSAEILEIADHTGDSFQLSQAAEKLDAPLFIVCGVHFMAETVKLLSPKKRVILANSEADCPMARQFTAADIRLLRSQYPEAAVVCYINTTAEIKAECDVCVTSATALGICRSLENKQIIFVPDYNLGSYCAAALPEKDFILLESGCCPIHASATAEDLAATRRLHPTAKLLCHPECRAEIVEKADFVGSTTAIMSYAERSSEKDFIIATENSIADHLSRSLPEKRFHILTKKFYCPDMRITRLTDVLHALDGTGGLEIGLDLETLNRARRCIDNMLAAAPNS